MIIQALSVRQPWAWAILNGKDIENRYAEFPQIYKGPFLLHTGQQCTRDEYQEGIDFMEQCGLYGCPALKDLPRGGIVGRVYVDRYTVKHNSKWFVGPLGIVLSRPKPLPFVRCPGQLGWFRVPPNVVAELKAKVAQLGQQSDGRSDIGQESVGG